MIRPTSKTRPTVLLNDYQVFKGKCEKTMLPFGQHVSAAHEAQLLIRDDRGKLAAGSVALYAIHQRSENRITQIVQHRAVAVLPVRPRRSVPVYPMLKAA